MALKSSYTVNAKNICTSSCNDGTVANLVANLEKICLPCHTDCASGKCIYGGDADYCTECSDSDKYLKIIASNYGNCVISNDCP